MAILLIGVCIIQDRINYAVITNNIKISVSYNNKRLFLPDDTCLGQVGMSHSGAQADGGSTLAHAPEIASVDDQLSYR